MDIEESRIRYLIQCYRINELRFYKTEGGYIISVDSQGAYSIYQWPGSNTNIPVDERRVYSLRKRPAGVLDLSICLGIRYTDSHGH